MIDTLTISMTPCEGALQRIVGLIERRGFDVRAINMPESRPDGAELTVRVAARDGNRCTEILSRQIMRLMDVTKVTQGKFEGGHS